MTRLQITDVRLTSAHAHDRGAGLIGYVTCLVNGQLRLDGLTLRRTRTGDIIVSYPARTDAYGREHYFLRPINHEARQSLERAILGALGFDGARDAADPRGATP